MINSKPEIFFGDAARPLSLRSAGRKGFSEMMNDECGMMN